VCTFGSTIPPATATNYQGLWWGAPGAETGWSLAFTHQDNVLVADWFTHDTDGRPMWLSAALFNATGKTYAGALIRTSGPPWNVVPFDPRAVMLSTIGAASVTFTDGNNAMFTYTIGGVTHDQADHALRVRRARHDLPVAGTVRSVRDDDEHAAWRVLDECARARATPPTLGPAVEVPVADDDQVRADLFCVTGNLLDGIADQDLAAGGMPGLGKSLQAVGKNFFIPLPLRFRVRPAVV
jgi:hypothetical protein